MIVKFDIGNIAVKTGVRTVAETVIATIGVERREAKLRVAAGVSGSYGCDRRFFARGSISIFGHLLHHAAFWEDFRLPMITGSHPI